MGSEISRRFWALSNGQAFGTQLANDPSMADLNRAEVHEILDLLAPLEGCQVLELGGGVGRFSAALAHSARRVVVMDICPEALAQNRQSHRDVGNLDFVVADLSRAELGRASFDVIFANWLMMYLDDRDTQRLISRMARAIRPGGRILLRESCRHNYRGRSRWRAMFSLEGLRHLWPFARHASYSFWRLKANWRDLLLFFRKRDELAYYREASCYEAWFESEFDIVKSGCIEAYRQRYGHDQQRFWILRKST